MPLRSIGLLLNFIVWVSSAHAQSIVDVVFDLDWTLVNPLQPQDPRDPTRTIEVEKQAYRLMDGVEEMLTELSQQKDVRVSFFSGGEKSRNETLLKKILLKDGSGRSAWDMAHKVLSRPDLTEVRGPPRAGEPYVRFSQRYKKDLKKVQNDLSNLVIIEDTLGFVPADQENNLIWLGRTYDNFESFQQVEDFEAKGMSGEYTPLDERDWTRDRKRIQNIHQALMDSLRSWRNSSQKLKFSQLMQKAHPTPQSCLLQMQMLSLSM